MYWNWIVHMDCRYWKKMPQYQCIVCCDISIFDVYCLLIVMMALNIYENYSHVLHQVNDNRLFVFANCILRFKRKKLRNTFYPTSQKNVFPTCKLYYSLFIQSTSICCLPTIDIVAQYLLEMCFYECDVERRNRIFFFKVL